MEAIDTRDGLWPVKTTELVNAFMDSRIWNRFRFRDDDVIIASWAKSGCTWLQQIVGQLLHDGDPALPTANLSYWVEMPLPSENFNLRQLEAQNTRRFMKTHLPVDALVYSPQAKYLFIARDARDVAFSLYNHVNNLNDGFHRIMAARRREHELPDFSPVDFPTFFRRWLERDGYPFWPFWSNIQSWWNIRHLPNVLMLHFSELKQDGAGSIRRIADFLGVEADAALLERVAAHSSFAFMKQHADRVLAGNGLIFEENGKSFFNKGANLQWADLLDASDLALHDAEATARLTPQCLAWLRSGDRQLLR